MVSGIVDWNIVAELGIWQDDYKIEAVSRPCEDGFNNASQTGSAPHETKFYLRSN